MCSNYLWLLVGIIIICSCLVIYGSSATTIKEPMRPQADGTCSHGWCLNSCGGCSPREESCGLGSNKWCDCHTKHSCTCTGCPRGQADCKRVGHVGEHPARSCPPTRPKQPDLNVTATMLASPGSRLKSRGTRGNHQNGAQPCKHEKNAVIYVIILLIVTTGDGIQIISQSSRFKRH